jgi:hypothetical protein
MHEKSLGFICLELYQLALETIAWRGSDAKKKSALLLDSEIRQLINNP